MNRSTLFNIAGSIWGLVGLFLIVRGTGMYQQAVHEQQASQVALTVSILASLIIGVVKGRFVFSKTARRNKARIANLPEPVKPHQVYAPKLYLLIVAMIGLGILLRTFNEYLGGYVVVGAVYCGIGVAMLVSSFYYWKREGEPAAEPGA